MDDCLKQTKVERRERKLENKKKSSGYVYSKKHVRNVLVSFDN